MTIEQLANLAEIIGGIAVIASLIYLAIEVRLNTKSVRAATLASNTDLWSSMLLEIAGDDKIDAYLMGAAGKEDIDPRHFLQFYLICRALFASWENQYYQYANGTLDEQIYLGYERSLGAEILNFPGFRLYWKESGSLFSPAFFARIDKLLNGLPEPDPTRLMKRWQKMTTELKAEKVKV